MTALKKMAALFAVAAFVVLSVSACNLFMSDEEVINKMMTRMAGVESYSGETQVSGAMAVEDVPSVSFEFLMSGNAYNKNVAEGEESDAAFDYNIDGNVEAQGQAMSFNADMKFLDEAMYFKVNTLPMIPLMDFSELTNKWIVLDFNAISELDPTVSASVAQPDFTDLMTYANELYQESNIFTLKEDLGSDKVGNNRVYHYSVDMNKEALAEMMMKIALKMAEDQNIDEADLAEAKEDMMTAFESLEIKNLELFIDKSDFYLRRMVMDMELSDPEGQEGTVSIQIDGLYDNFDKEVVIEAPEDASSFEELVAALGAHAINSFAEDNDIEMEEWDAEDVLELESGLHPDDRAMLEDFLKENPQLDLE